MKEEKEEKMPRVYLTEKERTEARLSRYILGATRYSGITITRLAGELDMTRQTMAKKIRNGSLTYYELWKLFRVLGTDEKTVLKLMGD